MDKVLDKTIKKPVCNIVIHRMTIDVLQSNTISSEKQQFLYFFGTWLKN